MQNQNSKNTHAVMRLILLVTGFKMLVGHGKMLTREFYQRIYYKASQLDDKLTYREFTRGLGKQIGAEICRWRAKGWIGGVPRYSYVWQGPRELQGVIKR